MLQTDSTWNKDKGEGIDSQNSTWHINNDKYSQIPPVNDQNDFPTYSCVRTKDTRAIPPFTIPTKNRETANVS